MLNISEPAFRFRSVVFLMLALLMGFGVYSYFTLPAQEDPKVTIREALVMTRFPGLSPERMERLVTKTLEEAIREIPEVEEIRSSSRAGLSIIHAKVYDRYFELDQIWDDLREKISDAASELPEGASTPVVNDDFGDVAVVTAALTSDGYSMGEMFDMAKHVRDQLYGVPGAKTIELHGVLPERVFIEASNARLAELGLSTNQIISTLQNQNVIRPGGEIDTGDRSFIVQPTGNFQTVDQIREILVPLPDNRGLIPLRDLAEIKRGTADPPQRKAYYNGEPAIIFAISMLDGYRVLDYAPQVRKKLSDVEATLPVGYKLDIVTYQAEQVGNAVFGVTINVVQTLAIVLAVVIVFLGLRTGLIVGSIVPSVMLVTLAIMGFTGIPLERMSLATLVIALGLLVDAGIVIAEDFKRRLEEGTPREEALRLTGGELALPLLSSTLTTILVFLPLMLAEHSAGEYTRSISLVILISLLSSWVLAMTVTPTLCYMFIKVEPSSEKQEKRKNFNLFGPMEAAYAGLLRGILRVRILFLIVMFSSLGLAGWAISQAPNKFFPESDRSQILITLDLPADVSLSATDRTLERLFPIISDKERFPYLDNYAAYAGYGGPRFVLSLAPLDPAPNKAFIVINLDTIETMPRALTELREMFRREFPGINARVTNMFLGPSDPGVFHVQAVGPDADTIFKTAGELESVLRDVPGMIDVWQDWENRIPKVIVEVDQVRARRAGVSSSDIARSLSAYYSGQPVSEFREGDDVFPIVARAQSAERSDIERLRVVSIERASDGKTVPLFQVATVGFASDFAVIQREDMTRTVTVEGRPLAMSPEDLVPLIDAKIETLKDDLPPGHTIEYDGIAVDSADGRAALAANIPLCIAVVLIFLVAQFNSIKRPLIIVATIPLLIVGVALGLHVMQADFGFMVILGILSLAGIIVNNAIVLIDRIDIEREHGQNETGMGAIVSASRRRLRPIIMTTVTTILGLLPLILANDPLFYGMASIMAFGLGVGTILTLGVVPAIYSLWFETRRAATVVE